MAAFVQIMGLLVFAAGIACLGFGWFSTGPDRLIFVLSGLGGLVWGPLLHCAGVAVDHLRGIRGQAEKQTSHLASLIDDRKRRP